MADDVLALNDDLFGVERVDLLDHRALVVLEVLDYDLLDGLVELAFIPLIDMAFDVPIRVLFDQRVAVSAELAVFLPPDAHLAVAVVGFVK